MTDVSPTLLVAVFADGPYWPSALEIIGPAAGCSFYRPYNYRRDWISRALDDALSDGKPRDLQAVVGMRFRRPRGPDGEPVSLRPEHNAFVPLRLAQAQVKRDEATVDIHLRLMQYVPLSPGTNDLWALEIEEAHRNNDAGGPMLAWYATPNELAIVEQWWANGRAQPDGRLWPRLGSSPILSSEARSNFEHRLVPFAGEVRNQRTGRIIRPVKLQEARTGTKFFGYELSVDRRIEIDIHTRRIVQPDEMDLPPGPDFEFITNPELVQPTVPRVPFTGNYRQTPVSLRPRTVVAGPAHLHWAPRFPPDSPPQDPRGDVALRLPFMIRRSWPWALILFAVLFMISGVAMIGAAITEQNWPAFTRSALQAVGVALISASVAFTSKAMGEVSRQS